MKLISYKIKIGFTFNLNCRTVFQQLIIKER